MEFVVDPELKEGLESKTQSTAPVSAAVREKMRFYRVRHRIYKGLIVFVVVAGLPVIGVPFLRHRLANRVQVLREAVVGGFNKPVIAKVGENREPFPEEYEHPLARPNYPKLPAYFNSSATRPYEVGQVYPARPAKKPKATPAEPEPAAAAVIAQEQQVQQETPAEDAQPNYRQGKIEQEAYDLLLKSDPSVAGLVQGSNSSLQFKSWDVAKREEDLYWVRLIFTQKPAITDMECIWQVQLMSKQVTPLNFNAKSLPRS